jgi:diguanylate cyclase (GGDEF)-like protein
MAPARTRHPGGPRIPRSPLRLLADVLAGRGDGSALELAAELALRTGGAASLSISRAEPRGLRTLLNVGALGPGEQRRPASERYPYARYPRAAALAGEARPYVVNRADTWADSGSLELLVALGKEGQLAVPLRIEEEVWGELWVASTRPLSRTELARFERVAEDLALVLGGSRDAEPLVDLASRDPVTRVANRAHFLRCLRVEVERAANGTRSLALLVCDVDDLAVINESWGRQAGDEVVLAVARGLRRASAPLPRSVVGRLGGDEFAVLVPGERASAGLAVAMTTMDELAQQGPAATLSCGVAELLPDDPGPEAVLHAAQHAHRHAKRSGGDAVEVCRERRPRLHVVGRRRRFLDEPSA